MAAGHTMSRNAVNAGTDAVRLARTIVGVGQPADAVCTAWPTTRTYPSDRIRGLSGTATAIV